MSIDFPLARADIERVLVEELNAHLVETHGHLSRKQAAAFAELGGVSVDTIWRMRRRLLRTAPPVECDGNLLERLAVMGKDGFVLDDTYWTLLYWLGHQKAVLAELKRAGLPVISAPTLSRLMAHAPRMLVDAVRHGLEKRHRYLLYPRRDLYEVDEVWEVDEVIIDIEFLAKPPGTGRRRAYALVLVDVRSGFIRAIGILDRPFRSEDFMQLLAAAAETWIDPDTQQVFGGICEKIVFDNAKAFANTKHDRNWVRILELAGATPGMWVPVPAMKSHAPYWWTGKPVVEGEINSFQRELVRGVPGQLSNIRRIDGNDMRSQADQFLLPWDIGVGLILEAVEVRNHSFSKQLGTSRAQYYRDHARSARALPDEALAVLYQPHTRNRGQRIVSERGVSIDDEWWVGDGVDIALDGGWRTGQGVMKPRIGDTVEVRVLNHRSDPAHYFPNVDNDGSVMVRTPAIEEPFGRLQDRAAILYEGRFTGWVYPGPTPEEVRNKIKANAIDQVRYVQQRFADARASARKVGETIELTGDKQLLESLTTREAAPEPDNGTAAPAVGQDASGTDDESRPGRRPRTRRGTKSNGATPPAKPKRAQGLDALAAAHGLDDDPDDEPDTDADEDLEGEVA